MNYSIASLLLALVATTAIAGSCPVTGDARNQAEAALNTLKNRPATIKTGVLLPVTNFTCIGDDTNRFDSATIATVTGYVTRVIPGGIESCNCHAADIPSRDTHIYIARDAKHTDQQQCMIAEVTPRTRQAGWSTAELKALVGKTVTFTGYLFFDAEHKQNAVNTNPSNKNDWRATAWEIHPVTGIHVGAR